MPRVSRHKWDEFAQLGLERSREHAPMVMAVDTEGVTHIPAAAATMAAGISAAPGVGVISADRRAAGTMR